MSRDRDTGRIALCRTKSIGASKLFFAAQWLAYAIPCQRFASPLAGREQLLEADLPMQGCLVLDDKMPGLNGLQLLTRLRARGLDLPAILITSNPSAATREWAAEAGVVIIGKPLLGNTLSDAICEAPERDTRC